MKQSSVLRGFGLAGLLLYLGLAFGVIPGPDRLVIALAFLVSPLAIIGMVTLYRRMREQNDSASLASGFVLLVSGFILFHLMIVVQQALFWFRDQAIASAADDAIRAQLRLVHGAVNGVQLGADVAFDVFYCLGILLISFVMYRDPRFGRIVAVFGMLSAGGSPVLQSSHVSGSAGRVRPDRPRAPHRHLVDRSDWAHGVEAPPRD